MRRNAQSNYLAISSLSKVNQNVSFIERPLSFSLSRNVKRKRNMIAEESQYVEQSGSLIVTHYMCEESDNEETFSPGLVCRLSDKIDLDECNSPERIQTTTLSSSKNAHRTGNVTFNDTVYELQYSKEDVTTTSNIQFPTRSFVLPTDHRHTQDGIGK